MQQRAPCASVLVWEVAVRGTRWALVESLPTPSAVRWLTRWTSAATRRFEDAPGASSHTSTRRHAINPRER